MLLLKILLDLIDLKMAFLQNVCKKDYSIIVLTAIKIFNAVMCIQMITEMIQFH